MRRDVSLGTWFLKLAAIGRLKVRSFSLALSRTNETHVRIHDVIMT